VVVVVTREIFFQNQHGPNGHSPAAVASLQYTCAAIRDTQKTPTNHHAVTANVAAAGAAIVAVVRGVGNQQERV
jgi:hypothetical protein